MHRASLDASCWTSAPCKLHSARCVDLHTPLSDILLGFVCPFAGWNSCDNSNHNPRLPMFPVHMLRCQHICARMRRACHLSAHFMVAPLIWSSCVLPSAAAVQGAFTHFPDITGLTPNVTQYVTSINFPAQPGYWSNNIATVYWAAVVST